MKKTYRVYMKINTVLYGRSIRHEATYITNLELDPRFHHTPEYEEIWDKPSAAMQALNENWLDIIDQLTPFITRSLDSNSDKSIVVNRSRRLLFNETSIVKVTEVKD